jgi:hypothetical protein
VAPLADQVYNGHGHHRKQGDGSERVEYRYGNNYIFHDPGFLNYFDLICLLLDWTSTQDGCSSKFGTV